jgi:hypothetical protein
MTQIALSRYPELNGSINAAILPKRPRSLLSIVIKGILLDLVQIDKGAIRIKLSSYHQVLLLVL